MQPITHRSILDRLEQIGSAQVAALEKAKAPFDRERESLVEACAGLGHMWGRQGCHQYMAARGCVVCGAAEPQRA